METVENIIAEMRKPSRYDGTVQVKSVDTVLNHFARRLEEAYRAERESIIASQMMKDKRHGLLVEKLAVNQACLRDCLKPVLTVDLSGDPSSVVEMNKIRAAAVRAVLRAQKSAERYGIKAEANS